MNAKADAAGDPREFASALRNFLRAQFAAQLDISDPRRLSGGASHETWAFDVKFADDSRPPLPLILRRNFSHDLIDARLDSEFALLEALHRHGQPVPRPHAIAHDVTGMGTPFMLMERAAGLDLRKALAQAGTTHDRDALARTLVEQQAAIHALPWRGALANILSAPENAAVNELERWVAVIEKLPRASSPLLAAAIAWLRTHLPPGRDLCLVHGDFKTNNLVLSGDGEVTILDWEMAHLGDPIEDLAWTMLWDTRDDLVGGLMPPADYLAAYAEASGAAVEPQRLQFWEIFSLVKLAAIFIAGITPARDGSTPRPMLVMLGRALPWIDARIAAQLCRTMTTQAAA